MTGKFKIPPKPVSASAAPESVEEFASGAAMVKSQTGGRPLKPVRINFDLDPAKHHRLRQRALDKGISVSNLVRDLIDADLAK